MRKREREQVAELLRCAADELLRGRYADEGFRLFENKPAVEEWATRAWAHEVCLDERVETDTHEQAAMRMLSAAQRIEEGSWP